MIIALLLSQALSFNNPCAYAEFPVRIQTNQGDFVAQQIRNQYPSADVEVCSWNKGHNGGVQIQATSRAQQTTIFNKMYQIYGVDVSK